MFLGVGLWACWEAIAMSAGSLQSPGPGLFPLLLGVAIAVLGAVLAGVSVFSQGPGGEGTVSTPRSAHARAVAAATVVLIAYTALLPVLGFGPATFILLVVLLRLGKMGWGAAVLVSLILAAGTLFAASLLNIPLPVGVMFPQTDV